MNIVTTPGGLVGLGWEVHVRADRLKPLVAAILT